MEQNGSFIKLQYELIQQINSQLQQQLLSQDQRADLLAEKKKHLLCSFMIPKRSRTASAACRMML